MKNKVLFGDEAREKLFAGIEKIYKSVGDTLGSTGRNAVFTRFGRPLVTNDGVSIANKINLEDEFEALGADLIKQAAQQTNEEAGDGTTTATVLAYHLIKEGRRLLAANPKLSPMKLRRELDDALGSALKELDSRAIKVKSDDDLLKIASLSSENDKIAEIVAAAVKKAGENGRVIVEESQSFDIEKEEIPGMELEGGYISPYMVTHPDRMESILTNPMILVTDRVFSLNKDLVPVLDDLNKRGIKDLLVVCKNMDSEILQTAVINRIKGLFHCVAVKCPRGSEWLEDLAAFVNADAVTDNKAVKQITIGHLGKAKKVVVQKDKFLVIPGPREPLEEERYQKRIENIKKLISESSGAVKNELEDRLARITGSVVLIKAGAPTEAEMSYVKLKIDDAVCAVKAAVKEGYVTGGGLTLRAVGDKVDKEISTWGSGILRLACQQPLQKLLDNSGSPLDDSKISDTDGFDTSSGKYVKNIAELGIIDPVIVEKSALRNAVSLAGVFLTIGTAIADIPEEDESHAKI